MERAGNQNRPEQGTLRTARRLRVTIDLPGFFVCPEDTDDDVEEAMALASRQVVVTFIGHEGDSPEKFLRTLEGTLVRIEVAE